MATPDAIQAQRALLAMRQHINDVSAAHRKGLPLHAFSKTYLQALRLARLDPFGLRAFCDFQHSRNPIIWRFP